jgi:hypothetical protein
LCAAQVLYGHHAVDHVSGHGVRRQVVPAAVVAHEPEGLVDVHVRAREEDTCGLFDQDAAVERTLQLLGEQVRLSNGTLLEKTDGGDVRVSEPPEPAPVLMAARICLVMRTLSTAAAGVVSRTQATPDPGGATCQQPEGQIGTHNSTRDESRPISWAEVSGPVQPGPTRGTRRP